MPTIHVNVFVDISFGGLISTECSSSQNDKDMFSAATERDSEKPTEVYIFIYGSY